MENKKNNPIKQKSILKNNKNNLNKRSILYGNKQ